MERKSDSFTLIELLVVIAIIAILAAMLLPALQKARDRAAAVKCQSNMKTLGNAMVFYGNDNGGFLPGYWNGGNYLTSTVCWFGAIPLSGREVSGTAGAYAGYLGVNQSGTIFGFYRNSGGKPFLCRFACPKLTAEALPGVSYRTGISMTGGGTTNLLYQKKVKLSMVRRPSRYCPYAESETTDPSKVIAWDNEGIPGQWKDGAAAYRHGTGANAGATMVFADSHVELRPKFKVPGKWNIGSPAYYCSFYNPWPLAGGESFFDSWN